MEINRDQIWSFVWRTFWLASSCDWLNFPSTIDLEMIRLVMKNGVIWDEVALFLANHIAANTIDFKMNVIYSVINYEFLFHFKL